MFPRTARYITQGVAQNVKAEIQYLLWQLIDNDLDQGFPLDYLQVFQLYGTVVNGKPALRITQRQEKPNRSRVLMATNITIAPSRTVWIVDSHSYCTMILPEEY